MTGGQRPLFFKMDEYIAGCGGPDYGAKRCFIRLRDPLDRTKGFQQLHLSYRADAGNIGKLRGEIAFFASLAVKLKRRFMRFFADLEHQSKCEGIAVERDRPVLASVDKEVRNLAVFLWRLNKPYEHYLFEVEFTHCGCCS